MSREEPQSNGSEAAAFKFRDQRVNTAWVQLEPAVRPLATIEEPKGDPVAAGTAVLIWHRGRRHILTAAHVLTDREGLTVYVGSGGHWIRLPDQFHIYTDGRADFAFAPTDEALAAKMSDCSFLGADRIAGRADLKFRPERDSLHVAFGYPQSRFRIRRSLKRVEYKSMAVLGYVEDPSVYDRLRLSPDAHVVIDHDQERSVTPRGIQQPPASYGMSGGGMFRFPALERPGALDAPRLAAIITGYDPIERAMIGDRIDVILNAIEATAIQP
jgi:hypothetical protein